MANPNPLTELCYKVDRVIKSKTDLYKFLSENHVSVYSEPGSRSSHCLSELLRELSTGSVPTQEGDLPFYIPAADPRGQERSREFVGCAPDPGPELA
jgi:hypothetical protein